MTNRFLPGLIALAFCFIIELPAYAQDPPTTEEKGRPPRMVVISPAPAQAPLSPEKKALIKELFGLLNSDNAAKLIAIQFLEQFQQSAIILIKSDLREWIQA